jgi:hypothetical protein
MCLLQIRASLCCRLAAWDNSHAWMACRVLADFAHYFARDLDRSTLSSEKSFKCVAGGSDVSQEQACNIREEVRPGSRVDTDQAVPAP